MILVYFKRCVFRVCFQHEYLLSNFHHFCWWDNFISHCHIPAEWLPRYV